MTYKEFKALVESIDDFYTVIGSNENVYVFNKICGNIMARIGHTTKLDYFMNDNFLNQFYEEIIEFTKSKRGELNEQSG